jgi:UTP--glucose-1-phosphate uridylyltransferase
MLWKKQSHPVLNKILFVTGRGKRAIEDHFDISFELNSLREKGKNDTLREVREIAEMIKIFYVRQKQALGLGHAILCAKEFIGNEPFAVLLGDDIIDAINPCLSQLMEVHRNHQGTVLALEQVPMENISAYGCVKANSISKNTYEVIDMVEKPKREDAPSDLAIIGSIFSLRNFPILENQPPGKGGEIQLTDALHSFRPTAISAADLMGLVTLRRQTRFPESHRDMALGPGVEWRVEKYLRARLR